MKRLKPLPILFALALCIIIVVAVTSFKKSAAPATFTGDLQSLDGQIFTLTNTISANPDNVKAYISLSQAYQQKIRETADTSYYAKIDTLMDKAEKLDPQNADIPATRAAVAMGRHNFKEGKVFIEKAISLNKNRDLYYGLLGDANIELGDYEGAAAAFQKMADIRPAYNSYTRIAYIRELYGDIDGAKEMLNLAIDAGSSFKESIAWAYVELAKLDMHTNLDKASENAQHALELVPDYSNANEVLGKIAFFKNDLAGARTYFEKAYTTLPLAQYAVDLGELDTIEHNTQAASQQYALAQISFDSSKKSGTNTDLEESLFLSEHDLNLPEALVKAERAYRERPNIYAADYLAWAQYKNGNAPKAAQYSQEALRLGENDALILFHQGMIALKNNNKVLAKKYLSGALKINPYFSMIHAQEAKDSLKTL